MENTSHNHQGTNTKINQSTMRTRTNQYIFINASYAQSQILPSNQVATIALPDTYPRERPNSQGIREIHLSSTTPFLRRDCKLNRREREFVVVLERRSEKRILE